jgi:hypothetical protein
MLRKRCYLDLLIFLSSFSSSSPNQELGRSSLQTSLNSTFCMVYPDLSFHWARTEESTVALLPFPHIQGNLVCISLFWHSLRAILILSFYKYRFKSVSSLVHPFTYLRNPISAVFIFHDLLFKLQMLIK